METTSAVNCDGKVLDRICPDDVRLSLSLSPLLLAVVFLLLLPFRLVCGYISLQHSNLSTPPPIITSSSSYYMLILILLYHFFFFFFFCPKKKDNLEYSYNISSLSLFKYHHMVCNNKKIKIGRQSNRVGYTRRMPAVG